MHLFSHHLRYYMNEHTIYVKKGDKLNRHLIVSIDEKEQLILV
jgi:hypothetical protein